MKKRCTVFLIILLAAVMPCAGLLACKAERAPKPEPVTVTPPENALAIYVGKAYSISVVRANGASDDCLAAADIITAALKELTGDDSYSVYPDSIGAKGGEIMIGNVRRDTAQAVKRKLSSERGYRIEVSADGIVITGSTDKYTRLGADCFVKTFLKANTVKSGNDIYIKYSEFDSGYIQPTLSEYIGECASGESSFSYETEKVFRIEPIDGYYVLQGGCVSADGKYYYLAMYHPKYTELTILVKYDMTANKVIKTNKTPGVGHANDICIVPEKNAIAVIHNDPDYKKISLFDADELTRIKTVTTEHKMYSIAYSAARKQYVVGISGSDDSFAILDENFSTVKKYTKPSCGGTHQGMDCDEGGIYFVQSDANGVNILISYDWDGKRIAIDQLPKVTYEIENITHYGNTFLLGFYCGYTVKGGEIYTFAYGK